MTLHNFDGMDCGCNLFEQLDLPRCDTCGLLVDKWNADAGQVALPADLDWDIARTGDGALIVSERFCEVYETHEMNGLEFRPLSNGYFWIVAENAMEYDAAGGKAELADQCDECGRFQSVLAATHHVRDVGTLGELSFARTDLEIGWRDEQAPLIICGPRVAEVVRNSKLRPDVSEPVVATSSSQSPGDNGDESKYEDLAVQWQYATVLLLQKHLRRHKVTDATAKKIVGDFIFDLSMLHDQEGLVLDEEEFTPRICFVDSNGRLISSNEDSNLHDYAFGNAGEAYGE